ncbi:MAG TPA: GNAT family N-acetyltransferase [Acidimicrobiales bacterium]|nr:GNAT family N-acetyltransferase [Acidimicrobiales bacterium]
MRDGLLIRPATAADEDVARRIHHEAFREVVERQFGPWDDARQDEFFAAFWRTGEPMVVEVDGAPCGYLGIAEADDVVTVQEIVLHPDIHGHGIGTELLEAIIERAAERSIRLQVLFENHRARSLYERLGFTEIGHSTTHHLMQWVPPGRPR